MDPRHPVPPLACETYRAPRFAPGWVLALCLLTVAWGVRALDGGGGLLQAGEGPDSNGVGAAEAGDSTDEESSADGAKRGDGEALAIRQEGVAAKVRALEETMLRLIQALRESEPEAAARLERALAKTKTERVRDRARTLAELLRSGALEPAKGEQAEFTAAVRAVLTLLVEEDEMERRKREIRRLRKLKRQVDELAKREEAHRRDSEKAADPEATSRMDQAIQSLKNLIQAQQGAMDAAAKAGAAGKSDFSEPKAEQEEVTKKTGDLLKKLDPTMAKQDSPEGAPKTESGKPKGDEGAEPGSQGKESQPGEPSESGEPGRSGEPGAGELARAVEQQRQAGQSLDQGRPGKAGKEQKSALRDMKAALKKLEAERDRLAGLQQNGGKELAKDQDATAEDTRKVQAEMEEHDATQPPGEPSTPGKEAVGQAAGQMGQASKSLSKSQPGKAQPKQREARDNLRQAGKDLQQRINELEEENRDEVLAELEAIFRAMLATQESVSTTTKTLHGLKAERAWTRTERVAVAKLAGDQKGLTQPTDRALALLRESGETGVFPDVLTRLREDIVVAADRLDKGHAAAYTQRLQAEIETTLRDLIAAMQKAQQDPPPQDQQQQQQQQQQEQPLFDELQKLRLLRAAQMRINRRTKLIDRLPKDVPEAVELEAETHRVRDRQAETLEGLRDLGKKQ